jgi:hypothetical protein
LNNFRKWHDADETIDVFGAERCAFGSRLGERFASGKLTWNGRIALASVLVIRNLPGS